MATSTDIEALALAFAQSKTHMKVEVDIKSPLKTEVIFNLGGVINMEIEVNDETDFDVETVSDLDNLPAKAKVILKGERPINVGLTIDYETAFDVKVIITARACSKKIDESDEDTAAVPTETATVSHEARRGMLKRIQNGFLEYLRSVDK